MPLERLVTNGQRSVGADAVAKFYDRPSAPARSHGGDHATDKPIVVRVGGTSVLYDGHSLTTAAILRGERTIDARVVDLDSPGD